MKMIWKTALHYAQFWFVLALVSGQLTVEQQEEILDLHNQYRGMISPEAADMLHMTWNESLALVAQSYALQCNWEHNQDLRHLGENLFITTGQQIINVAMAEWFDEYRYYDYDSDICLGAMCGHYTQIVWAKSKTVGCGAHFCEKVANLSFQNATILVCNYYPQGNIEGVRPYEKGQPCSNCPQEMSECIEKTCAQTKSTTEEPSACTWQPNTPPTEEPSKYTWRTNTPWTEPAGSTGFINLSERMNGAHKSNNPAQTHCIRDPPKFM